MLYSQIKQYLNHGLMVEVINKNKKFRVFYWVLSNGNLEATQSNVTLQENSEKDSVLWNEEEINEREKNYGWKIHSLLPRPITPYPVGMKVRVSEEWFTEPYLNQAKEVFTIKNECRETTGQIYYELKKGQITIYVNHRFLIPVLEEENPKNSWLEEGRKNGWVKGGEVIE